MNEILMCGTDPVGQLYKDTKAEATSIAPIEVSPAESSHSVGTHIMVDGVRYKVTSAISIGDTLTIGTNISAENIEDNLNAEDVAYDSNTSVKEKIDELEDSLFNVELLADCTDMNTEYNLSKDLSNFKLVLATAYLSQYELTTTIIPISTITYGTTNFICCYNDGTVRKGQIIISSTSKVKTGSSSSTWQNITGVRIYGIK